MSRTITEIIVHCTATPEGRHVTVADVTRCHRLRNFSTIGYHYLIYLDGSVHAGRAEWQVGAHCSGHNAHSIGVCYVGGLEKDCRTPRDTRTPQQRASMLKLLKGLKAKYPNASIHGHRDFAAKACPCFDATKEYAAL